ncbi:hypothetical protein D3C81_704350 [compost metagenome]
MAAPRVPRRAPWASSMKGAGRGGRPGVLFSSSALAVSDALAASGPWPRPSATIRLSSWPSQTIFQASPQTCSDASGRQTAPICQLGLAGMLLLACGPHTTIISAVPLPGAVYRSNSWLSRRIAPSPTPYVPVVDWPSCMCWRTLPMPGPWSMASTSMPLVPPRSTLRSRISPRRACLMMLVAASLMTMASWPARTSSKPTRRASSLPARRAAAISLGSPMEKLLCLSMSGCGSRWFKTVSISR